MKTLPKKEAKVLVQSRASKQDVDLLKKAGVDIPELIRQAVADAASQIKGQK
jgi:predicted Fe-Mo cluster-binding NifX family protein